MSILAQYGGGISSRYGGGTPESYDTGKPWVEGPHDPTGIIAPLVPPPAPAVKTSCCGGANTVTPLQPLVNAQGAAAEPLTKTAPSLVGTLLTIGGALLTMRNLGT